MKKTKIICTLGPSSYETETLKKLILNGLNIARFNFSHAEYEKSRTLIKIINDLNKKLKTSVSILLDTKGPEIRTHQFDGEVDIKKDSIVNIFSEEILGNSFNFSVTYPQFYEELNIGDIVYVDDGYLSLEVIDKIKNKRQLVTKAKNTHKVKSRRGINVPNVDLKMKFISEKDHNDIIFAIKENYDYIAASFTRSSQDIKDIREILKKYKNNRINVIAKIENQSGIDNIEEIIEVSDGIMIARGDLGIEIPDKTLPFIQKKIIKKCLEKGKPVIVATQMLESMQKNPRPTKAEISDVFNSVQEGTSANMLSGESASGIYPIESTKYMNKINLESEKTVNYDKLSKIYQPQNIKENLLLSVVEIAFRIPDSIIIVYNFEDAFSISKFHPSVYVLALVKNLNEAKMLSLNFGIIPILKEEELNKKIMNLKQKKQKIIFFKNDKIEIK
jgi:pyruvate kinase